MKIDLKSTANRLLKSNNVVILTHRRPDGDTIGTAMGLHYALKQINIKSVVKCADDFPDKFAYLYKDYTQEEFTPEFVVAVDVATERLLGELMPVYTGKIDLAIDHHKSNEFYAKETYLDVDSPATAEAMYMIISEMNIPMNKNIADALFTGIMTDTGGLRFQSVTSRTYRVCADLVDSGADHGEINRVIFESVSKQRLKVEAFARENMEYYLGDKCAVLYLPADLKTKYGIAEEELDGISSLPRTVEGVDVGVTLRDLGENAYRVSLRTRNPVDSARICSKFGGGGHANAGGCTMRGELEDVKKQLLAEVENEIKRTK